MSHALQKQLLASIICRITTEYYSEYHCVRRTTYVHQITIKTHLIRLSTFAIY